MRYLSIEDINAQQTTVLTQSKLSLAGFYDYSATALNTLIRLLYAAPRNRAVSPVRGVFTAQSLHWFYSAVYTSNAAIQLMGLGYYLEAQVLFRALIDIFVKLRYFDLHPEDMDRLLSTTVVDKCATLNPL